MKVAIVIGHTADSPGAGGLTVPLGRENAWASAVAAQVKAAALCSGVDVVVVRQWKADYPEGLLDVCARVNAELPDLVIAVHANGGAGAPQGKPGAMYQPGDAVGERLAKCLGARLASAYPGKWGHWSRAQVRSWSASATDPSTGKIVPTGPEFRIMTATDAPAVILETHRIDIGEHMQVLDALDAGLIGPAILAAVDDLT